MGQQKINRSPRELRGAAAAAAAIKSELTNAFPGVKFSVTSSTFAGGDSVQVAWTDGPTTKLVESHSSKYQAGYFNGMEDIYEYSNERSDIPQAKYVQESRSMSEPLKAALLPACQELYHRDCFDCHDASGLMHRIFWNTAIPANATVLGLEPTGKTSGPGSSPEHFYRIRFSNSSDGDSEHTGLAPTKIQIIDYSAKAIAVTGDTKAIKDKLKALGGRFNRRLTCGAGWIFPKSKLEEVRKILIAYRHV